jgi:hypothetical protein
MKPLADQLEAVWTKVRATKKRMYLAWVLMIIQMYGWTWMQDHGGKLDDWQYLAFNGMLILGQFGVAIECTITKAWGTLFTQFFYFAVTVYGSYVRWRMM